MITDWICEFCQNINSRSMLNCNICFTEKLTVENMLTKIILKGNDYYETLSNLDPSLREKGDLLIRLIRHENFGPYLKDKFLNNEINVQLLNDTLSEFVVLEDIMNILQHQCAVCGENFPFTNMCKMISCDCVFCQICLKEWLKEKILSKSTNDLYCPSCPNGMKKVDKNLHFLSFQKIINSDETLKNIFHDKLRDEQLQFSQNFRWCPNEKCANGFEIMNLSENVVKCPVCELLMCIICNVEWHTNETCEEYQIRILKDDPKLSKVMMQIKIECPNCKMQFDLAKGGCLHFKCSNCFIDFCGCCKNIFKKDNCEIPNCNYGNSFHAHHPNNCLYYTRDYEIVKLISVLKVKHFQAPQRPNIKTCSNIVTDNKFKDSKCKKACYNNVGLCTDHYKEYLCLLIFKYDLDVSSIAKEYSNPA